MDVSSSVSEVYLRLYTAVSGAFSQLRKRLPLASPGSESCAGRPDMTFLDFWSTSSAFYESDEGLKDAGAEKGHISPATGSAPDFGTCCLKIHPIVRFDT